MDTPIRVQPDAGDSRCSEVRELLSAYHDNELTDAQASIVVAHLAGCAECTRELEEIKRTSAAVRGQLRPFTAPESLRTSARAALRDETRNAGSRRAAAPRSRRAWWIRQVAAGIVIAAASSALTLVAVRRPSPDTNQLLHSVVVSHVRALMSNHVTDVVSTDQHTVKPWFNGKVDFSPEVVRLDSAGFPLTGGRVDSVGSRAVAALVYARRNHVIDLYTWPAGTTQAANTEPEPGGGERGYNTIHWRHDRMEFWAVSDLNGAELGQFVEAFRRG